MWSIHRNSEMTVKIAILVIMQVMSRYVLASNTQLAFSM